MLFFRGPEADASVSLRMTTYCFCKPHKKLRPSMVNYGQCGGFHRVANCGWTKFCTNLKRWEGIVCWYFRGNRFIDQSFSGGSKWISSIHSSASIFVQSLPLGPQAEFSTRGDVRRGKLREAGRSHYWTARVKKGGSEPNCCCVPIGGFPFTVPSTRT